MTPLSRPARRPDLRGTFALLGCAALLGTLSVWLTQLSIFAILLLVVALAATSRLEHVRKRLIVLGLTASLGLALIGLTRFALGDALQGIIEARGRATSSRAVSILREILFAEDAMRRYAFVDPDGDGVGSAGLLGELSGAQPARGGRPLATPPLAPRFAPGRVTRSGPALESDGYLFLLCLPRSGGGWATSPAEPVDEELAERRWLGYAWPASANAPHETAFFIDEHERILESQNRSVGGGLRLVGPEFAPDCDDYATSSGQWKAWRGKTPRATLAGDPPARP